MKKRDDVDGLGELVLAPPPPGGVPRVRRNSRAIQQYFDSSTSGIAPVEDATPLARGAHAYVALGVLANVTVLGVARARVIEEWRAAMLAELHPRDIQWLLETPAERARALGFLRRPSLREWVEARWRIRCPEQMSLLPAPDSLAALDPTRSRARFLPHTLEEADFEVVRVAVEKALRQRKGGQRVKVALDALRLFPVDDLVAAAAAASQRDLQTVCYAASPKVAAGGDPFEVITRPVFVCGVASGKPLSPSLVGMEITRAVQLAWAAADARVFQKSERVISAVVAPEDLARGAMAAVRRAGAEYLGAADEGILEGGLDGRLSVEETLVRFGALAKVLAPDDRAEAIEIAALMTIVGTGRDRGHLTALRRMAFAAAVRSLRQEAFTLENVASEASAFHTEFEIEAAKTTLTRLAVEAVGRVNALVRERSGTGRLVYRAQLLPLVDPAEIDEKVRKAMRVGLDGGAPLFGEPDGEAEVLGLPDPTREALSSGSVIRMAVVGRPSDPVPALVGLLQGMPSIVPRERREHLVRFGVHLANARAGRWTPIVAGSVEADWVSEFVERVWRLSVEGQPPFEEQVERVYRQIVDELARLGHPATAHSMGADLRQARDTINTALPGIRRAWEESRSKRGLLTAFSGLRRRGD